MASALLAGGLGWVTAASLATAAGTLVLAVATFSSVRSANRTARAAERSLLAGTQPVLMPSRPGDPSEKIMFVDNHWVHLDGGRASAEVGEDALYLAIALHNVGPGLGVIQAWDIRPDQVPGQPQMHRDPGGFRPQFRDLYIPAGDYGFWQAALRDKADPAFAQARAAIEGRAVTVDLLYSDSSGGQRTITRFHLLRADTKAATEWFPSVTHHWHLDGPSPR